jgi:hypothetical protein
VIDQILDLAKVAELFSGKPSRGFMKEDPPILADPLLMRAAIGWERGAFTPS